MDKYIKTFPKDVQIILEKIRQTILRATPAAVEAIRDQIPAFKLNGKYLVYFAAWKSHIVLYPIPLGTEAFEKELSSYKTSKGTVPFPLEKPIPHGLVKKIVIF